jgi:hypothetical protein
VALTRPALVDRPMLTALPLAAGFAAQPPTGFGAGDGLEAGGAATWQRPMVTAAQRAATRWAFRGHLDGILHVICHAPPRLVSQTETECNAGLRVIPPPLRTFSHTPDGRS